MEKVVSMVCYIYIYIQTYIIIYIYIYEWISSYMGWSIGAPNGIGQSSDSGFERCTLGGQWWPRICGFPRLELKHDVNPQFVHHGFFIGGDHLCVILWLLCLEGTPHNYHHGLWVQSWHYRVVPHSQRSWFITPLINGHFREPKLEVPTIYKSI